MAADAIAVLIVYSAVDPGQLRNVSLGGLEGGLARALVQLNYPIALAAAPLTLLALDALPRRAWLAGIPAIALCLVVAWPGVVDPDDLDAKVVNVLPALGVAVAASLTVAAALRAGAHFAPARKRDRLRIIVAVVAVLLSLPWIAAEAGLYFPQGVFLTTELYAEPKEPPAAAVHLGHHHGFAGTLLVISALLLSRARLAAPTVRRFYAALVSLMLVYGIAILVNDLWHEQVVKRGWTSWDVPSALEPSLSRIWVVVLAVAGLVYALGFARGDAAGPTRDNHIR